jgi:hypothetical protein
MMVKQCSTLEVGKRRWEIVNRLFEIVFKFKTIKRGREIVNILILKT